MSPRPLPPSVLLALPTPLRGEPGSPWPFGPLTGLTEAEAEAALAPLGARPEQARTLWAQVLKRRRRLGELTPRPRLPRALIRAAQDHIPDPRLELVRRDRDPTDGFLKLLFRLEDGPLIEAVRIPIFDTHYVVCVSSQAGCAFGCAFCATGRLGLARHLEAWEIVEQVLTVREHADRPVRGVVFMGMGEPFHNYDQVIRAATILASPSGPAIGAKSITLSTVGLVPQIRRFTAEGHKQRLAVSLTSAIGEKRAEVLPVEGKWSVEEVFAATRDHASARRRRALLAWVAIRGFNTGEDEARALARLVGDTPVMVDLIDVNDATGRFLPPEPEELSAFRGHLNRHLGQPVIRRYSGGKEVNAACGMLAGGATLQAAEPGVR